MKERIVARSQADDAGLLVAKRGKQFDDLLSVAPRFARSSAIAKAIQLFADFEVRLTCPPKVQRFRGHVGIHWLEGFGDFRFRCCWGWLQQQKE